MRPAALFLLTYVISEAAVRGMTAAGWLRWLQVGTARASAAILGVAGDVSVRGPVITVGQSTVNVSGYCIPTSAIALSIALMIAGLEAPVHRRAAWSLGAIGAVLLANVLRVVVVAWLAWTKSPALDPLHTDVLPIVLALTGLGVWWLALGWERQVE